MFLNNYDLSWTPDIKEQTIGFTGYNSDKISPVFTFKEPIVTEVSNNIISIIEKIKLQKNINYFLSGGETGMDQISFWSVEKLKKKYPELKNILLIPGTGQEHKMNEEQQLWYNKMVQKADEVIEIYKISEYDRDRYNPAGRYSTYKIKLKNQYIVDKSSIVISLWDNSKTNLTEYMKDNKYPFNENYDTVIDTIINQELSLYEISY